MSTGPTFVDIIVSELGSPQKPIGIEDFLLLLGILAACLAIEQGLVLLFQRLLPSPQTEAKDQQELPLH